MSYELKAGSGRLKVFLGGVVVGKSIVQEKSYELALRIVQLCGQMMKQGEYVLSKQLLKSGTSIGANVEEALAGQSRRDFLAKMSIATKEARETRYWLRLIRDAGLIDESAGAELASVEELIRILTSIVKTSAERGQRIQRQDVSLITQNS